MGILTSVACILVIPACYSPDLRDCTIRCVAESDCAAGQVCGSDLLCASPEIAGRCSTLPGDAGAGDRDATAIDATLFDAAPDAATTAELLIKIEGKGTTTLASGGSCDDTAPDHECSFILGIGLPVSLDAAPGEDFHFDTWSAGPCIGSTQATCGFVITSPTYVGAKFRK